VALGQLLHVLMLSTEQILQSLGMAYEPVQPLVQLSSAVT
jgi:hypothetical protein